MGQLQIFPLNAGMVTIGRAETCQLRIEGDLVSREHTRMEREPDGRWRVSDLGSRNKTFLNGLTIADVLLSSGDVIRLGSRQLEYHDPDNKGAIVLKDSLSEDRADPAGAEYVKLRDAIPLKPKQMEQLSQLTFDASAIPSIELLSDGALTRILTELKADRGFVAIRGTEGQSVDVTTYRGLGKQAKPLSQKFVQAGLVQGLAGRYPASAASLGEGEELPATAMVAPLLAGGKPIGLIYVDRPIAKKQFEQDALYYLMAAGVMLGSAITQSHRRLGTLQSEMGAARLSALRRIQANMTDTLEAGEQMTLHDRLIRGNERCGDLRLAIPLEENRLLLAMVDAGGSGISGLMQGASILAAIRTVVQHDGDHIDLVATMNSINQSLAGTKTRQLVACSVLLLDPLSEKLTYINAGMPAGFLLIAPGRSVPLERTTLLPGVQADYLYEATTIDLPETFRLVCYSDGLPEAAKPNGDPLGEPGVHNVLLSREVFGMPASALDALNNLLNEHLGQEPPSDDATIVVISRG
jgi:serine phosphatase RsbU (regulator of sigma subunit)